MNEKIQVLDLEIDNLSAKDAMKLIVDYMGTEPVSVIEMVTMNTLGRFQQDEEAKAMFQSFELALASDKGILQAAGVKEERRLREVAELLFIKMVMRYLHKNAAKVFLLAENAVDLEKLEGYMNEDYANIQIVGTATLEENAVSDDMLLNLVNGAEVDCVLSTLSSPTEEEFIYRNKTLVNARVWLGFGDLLGEMRKQKNVFLKVKEFVLRQILKREMAKKGENA
ncbi:MAG: WecB/TagA/CpsF family glycosyltransferase [Tyzzerella sp.]|nr:WecB/TagA/CpsF family glycosyltransferase [Tyzzerella sp.]